MSKVIKIVFFACCMLSIYSCSTVNVAVGSKHSKKSRVKKSRSSTYVHTSKKAKKKRTSIKRSPNIVGKRAAIVSTAKKYLGNPYRYGGKKPEGGFDCSGFTSYVYTANGISVNGASYEQAKKGKRKSLSTVEAGDLIVFGKQGKVSHVAIVAEVDDESLYVVHSTSSRGVVVDEISHSPYWKKRILYAKDVIN